MKHLLLALCLSVCAAAPASAATATYSFDCLTNTNADNCSIGEAQLSLNVTDTLVSSQVLFEFTNTGAEAASITDIYFDDGTLFGISQVFNGSGVNFSVLAVIILCVFV